MKVLKTVDVSPSDVLQRSVSLIEDFDTYAIVKFKKCCGSVDLHISQATTNLELAERMYDDAKARYE